MASRLVQTRLGVSDSSQLILVTPPRSTIYPDFGPCRRLPRFRVSQFRMSTGCNTQAFILNLPTELLQQVMQAVHDIDIASSTDSRWCDACEYCENYADSSPSEDDEEQYLNATLRIAPRLNVRYAAVYATVLTCKKFHAIAIPILYSRPRFEGHCCGPDRSLQCNMFYSTIRRYTGLRPFIRHLVLQHRGFDDKHVQMCLTFPHLESLVLISPKDDKEGDSRLGEELRSVSNHAHDIRCTPQLLTQDEAEGTTSLTELRLRQIRSRPGDVKRFLKLIHRLEVFAMDDVIFTGYDWEDTEPDPTFRWTYDILIDVLSCQRHNLQTLELGWLSHTWDQNQLDVCLFPNLRTLQLGIAHGEPVVEACRNWLTSTLKTIILDPGANDSQSGKDSSFGLRESRTILRFTESASLERKRRSDSMGLKEIGFLAHHSGNSSWTDEEEWQCDHKGVTGKRVILKTLRAIEAHGFSAFWVGASGARHTARMIQEACSVCASTANRL